MVPDAQSPEFVTAVRPARVWRPPLVLAAVSIVLFGMCFIASAGEANGGANLGGMLVLWLLFSGVLLLFGLLPARGLGRSTFVVDTDGMEVRTPSRSERLAWSDVESVTLAAEPDAHLLLATLRPGVVAPLPTRIGIPRWSSQRRCLLVVQVEMFDTTPADVCEALRRYGGDAFRPDGRL